MLPKNLPHCHATIKLMSQMKESYRTEKKILSIVFIIIVSLLCLMGLFRFYKFLFNEPCSSSPMSSSTYSAGDDAVTVAGVSEERKKILFEEEKQAKADYREVLRKVEEAKEAIEQAEMDKLEAIHTRNQARIRNQLERERADIKLRGRLERTYLNPLANAASYFNKHAKPVELAKGLAGESLEQAGRLASSYFANPPKFEIDEFGVFNP